MGVGPLLRTFQSQCSSSCPIVSASRWQNTGRRTPDQPKSNYAMGHNRDTEVRGLPTPRAQGWFHTGSMVGEGLGTGTTHSEDKWDKGLGLGSTPERRVLDQVGGSTLHFVDGQTEGPGGMGPFWPTSPGPVEPGSHRKQARFGNRPHSRSLGLEVLTGVGSDLPPAPSYEPWASSLLSPRAIFSGLSLSTQETGLWRMRL